MVSIETTWREGFLRVAKDSEIGKEAFRVLFAILGSVTEANFSPLGRAEIGRLIEMHPANVGRAVKLLEGKGIVKRRTRHGKTVGYEVMEHFGASR